MLYFTDYAVRELTAIKIGGVSVDFFMPQTVAEVTALAVKFGTDLIMLGGGTNLVFAARVLRPVATLSELPRELKVVGVMDEIVAPNLVPPPSKFVRLAVSAAVSLPRLVNFAAQRRLRGLENLAGIPGTVGGAIAMNAGTPVATISDYLISVDVCLPENNWQVATLRPAELNFAYRSSRVQTAGGIVIGAQFALPVMPHDNELPDKNALLCLTRRIRARRASTQIKFPNCGSVFKNPHPENPAGKLLEAASVKGKNYGDLYVSEIHANFFENRGRATFADFNNLLQHAQTAVAEKFGITLIPEVKIYS